MVSCSFFPLLPACVHPVAHCRGSFFPALCPSDPAERKVPAAVPLLALSSVPPARELLGVPGTGLWDGQLGDAIPCLCHPRVTAHEASCKPCTTPFLAIASVFLWMPWHSCPPSRGTAWATCSKASGNAHSHLTCGHHQCANAISGGEMVQAPSHPAMCEEKGGREAPQFSLLALSPQLKGSSLLGCKGEERGKRREEKGRSTYPKATVMSITVALATDLEEGSDPSCPESCLVPGFPFGL